MIRAVKNLLIRWLILLGLKCYNLLLYRFDRQLEPLLARLALYLAKTEKKRAIEQLEYHLDGVDQDQAENICKQMAEHFALSLIEALELGRAKKLMLAKIKFAPGAYKKLMDAHEAGKGIVFATGHIGNWELMAALLSETIQTHTISKKSYDPVLDKMIVDFRKSYGINPIDRDADDLWPQIKQILERGEFLAILVDQDTDVSGQFAPFFKLPAHTPTGAASIAIKTGASLLVGWSQRGSDGHLLCIENLSVEPLQENETDTDTNDTQKEVLRLTTEINKILEQAIVQKPEQWVWFHERWKTKHPTEDF